MNFKNTLLFLFLTHEILNLMTAYRRISKGQRYSIIRCRCPQSTTSQAPSKRKAPKSTKTQPKRQKTAPSSLPHPAPQIQADLADAPEQTADPLDQGMSSAIAPEQMTITLPQRKVSIIK
jgi:hypothetical protein